jgi:phosphoglucosamine mutase
MGKLFGTDGVRGVAGRYPLTVDFIRRLGWAAGSVLSEREPRRPKTLFIVRDPRSSGPVLLRALAEGLGAAGFSVLDGGVLPTPAVAALLPTLPVVAGAVISASHNPATHNGVKFFGPGGHKLNEEWEDAIEHRALSNQPLPSVHSRIKPFPQAREHYLHFLEKTWPQEVSLRGVPLVLDCAQGATSAVAPVLFRRLGAKVTVISASPNGRNINRRCGALHPQALAKAVRRTGARLGVAFDGDGDRAIFVDEGGHPRDGDAVLLAAARHLKVRGRLTNNSVVVTVMSNLGLHRALDALGFQREVTAVGDKYVWQGMRKTGAALGGEPSGHVIFRDFLPTGDGILTALQVAALLVETGRNFSSLTSLAVHYPQVLLNVPVRERRPLEKIPGFLQALAEVNRVLGDTGRTLIRYSGTEPLLRIMIEGPNRKVIQSHAEALARVVRAG